MQVYAAHGGTSPVCIADPVYVEEVDMQYMYVCMCMFVCMGSLYCCIVACAHLGNGTGRRTATLVAPLLLTSGPLRYEAVLQSCGTSPVGGGGTDL